MNEMTAYSPVFLVKLARNRADVQAAQRLRYDVFVSELGSDGAGVDHANRLEQDRFDDFARHLLLYDMNRAAGDRVIGTYRLMTKEDAAKAGQFYCEDEYDLSLLKQSGKRLLELGRSCLHPDYRGGPAMFHMWSGLADFVKQHQIELIFGVASFHGTDTAPLAQPLSMLHHRHLAPDTIRAKARPPGAQNLNLVAHNDIDRRQAMLAIPALIKAYLRLGGVVGDGAFVDHDFNTIDICLILETDAINAMQRSIYSKGQGLE